MGSPETGISVDENKPLPLSQQIAEAILARIDRGLWPRGYRLPSTRALADELSVHRTTVVRAYDMLTERGHVESFVGRGTFVTAQAVAPVAAARPREAIGAPRESGLPWQSLLSKSASAEALSRPERLPRQRPVYAEDMIDLTRMQPSTELMPADELRACMDSVLRQRRGALGYAPREGLGRLRECLVEDLARKGVPASPEHLLVTTGSQQALDLIARALINPGDAFAIEAQSYSGAINLLSVAGARLVSIPTDDEGPQMGALEHAATRGLRGVYLMPNGRNPTGSCISRARRHSLIEWSRREGVPLIEDDYDVDLVLDPDAEAPPPALRALDVDVLHVSGFSKRLIPSLRLGFVLCPPGLHRTLVALKYAQDLGCSALLQHAAAEFLERGYLRAHLRHVLPIYRSRRDALEEALNAHLPEDIDWRHMTRGLVMWLALPPGLRADDLFIEAQRHGVLVSPASLHTPALGEENQRGVRLTIASESADRIAEGVRRLGAAIDTLSRQRQMSPQSRSLSGI